MPGFYGKRFHIALKTAEKAVERFNASDDTEGRPQPKRGSEAN